MVLNKAPTKYSAVLTCMQRQKGSALMMNDLQSAMMQLYCTIYSEEKGSDNTLEVKLSLTNSEFKCYNCGGKGHKAFQCTESKKKKGGTGRNSKKQCGHCGPKGHNDKDY
eukprot:15341016-Ditylum_brightwellii.AAC.1